MSEKRTSIKTTEAVRDRLMLLASERGTTLTALLEEFAAKELTEAEREQRAREAATELGVEYTPKVKAAGTSAWEKVRAHSSGQSGSRAA
jgi:hypothetical protein